MTGALVLPALMLDTADMSHTRTAMDYPVDRDDARLVRNLLQWKTVFHAH